jgi:heat-inducible transcriptional repressor
VTSAEPGRELVELHRSLSEQPEEERSYRSFAQSLSNLTRGTVFMSADDDQLHLAGISYLLRHPEFRDEELMLSVTKAMDHLDQILAEVESRLSRDVDVLIGEENPFGAGTSTIVLKYRTPRMGEGIVGLLGPQRMDYESNYALMRSLRDVLGRPLLN